MKKITRIGIGGPVGSGKTAVIETITPRLIDRGVRPLIITNDVVTTEDAKQVRRTLQGILVEEKIVGVETGACPHTAVREDPSMNIAAVEELEGRYPDSDVVLIESGGDNLTLTFSPALADFYIYVIDVAAGDKIPRKNGAGVCQSDILVINKIDLAPFVDASLAVMDRDSRLMRGTKPFVFTNCKTGEGVETLMDMIMDMALFDVSPAPLAAAAARG
ncbi:urease accessory protein UreG [Sphingomonas sp. 3-13AW]|jgi:urease accessory protein|uniref:urease accessory protein UreG n=1 Tax=Sphingomonas sp. 3-13AW TaxID=3050450 RepID=UPI003BB4BAF6